MIQNGMDKGKQAWVRKPKPKPKCISSKNAKLILEKRSQLDREAYNGDDNSTSSDENQEIGFFSDSCSLKSSDNSPSSNSMKSQSAKTVQHFEEDPPDSVSYAEQSQEDPVCDFIEGDMGRGM
ncbi:hypothetical protein QYF36_006023 [Acer negundo]|nr:hypothetical protein QYF36_006023 [Acer negundo]